MAGTGFSRSAGGRNCPVWEPLPPTCGQGHCQHRPSCGVLISLASGTGATVSPLNITAPTEAVAESCLSTHPLCE